MNRSPPAGRPRGSFILYAASFVVMLASGLVLAIEARAFLDDLNMLWISSGLSAVAIVLAIAAVVVPRRR